MGADVQPIGGADASRADAGAQQSVPVWLGEEVQAVLWEGEVTRDEVPMPDRNQLVNDKHREVADVIAGALWVAGNLYVGINCLNIDAKRARIVDGIAAILRREYGDEKERAK